MNDIETKELRQNIIKQIVQARTAKGLSQAQLAMLLGTHRSNISRLESGEHNPSLNFLLRIASVLDMEPCLIPVNKEPISAETKIILETPRLMLREMTKDDYPALAAILQDEQTMYAYEGAFSDEETLAWLDRQMKNYSDYEFGLWAVLLKENGEMIGQTGVTWQKINDDKVPEVGYLFNRAFWGHGYATEAAIACKQYAFEKIGFNEVYTIVRDSNIPSINVAIRNGMLARFTIMKHYRGVDMPHYVFSARK